MRKGQRASSSSESEENQQQSSTRGRSSKEDLTSDSDVEAEAAMKRSQRFSRSFSFGEDQQRRSNGEDRGGGEGPSPKTSNGVPIVTQFAEERMQVEKHNAFCETNPPPTSNLFRPQELWLAVTRCLSLRWPPCLSVNRQGSRKLAFQVDFNQSADTQSSSSSSSANGSPSPTFPCGDRNVTLAKREREEVKSGPPPLRGLSRSSPRVQRAGKAADSVLASMVLDKEMFLRIELVDAGEEREDLRYRAEWKLSERTKELAEGIWLSRSQTTME